ncbi:hypothetical protein BU16DRAFT_586014 [Lophium mytilinum]|uniref:Uncharacterized protein n=1 Tax=Lophium mytilinum TaxID=390894 RepID=A0A6A6QCT7_9PEZI|nr:hypothetical protein BU16DRAFT_586014 [Lophium mytilinum]
MEKPWAQERWEPTIAVVTIVYPTLSVEEYRLQAASVRELTNSIIELPYHPSSWIRRAEAHTVLVYPELAIGDAYKARLLVEAALSNTTELGEMAVLVYGMSDWMNAADQWAQAGLGRLRESVAFSSRPREGYLDQYCPSIDAFKGLVGSSPASSYRRTKRAHPAYGLG